MRSILFLLIILSLFHSANSKSLLHLRRGASISVESNTFITSPDNSFTCGFYGLGSNAYWFAIWFTNSKERAVVWTANRDNPVNSQGSRVSIRRDGTIVLTDVDRSIVWQTNRRTTDVSAAELLNTGNLVLKNPRGDILWQSFDVPTDTLLPSQILTKDKRLISSLRKGSFESGYFNLYFGSDNVLSLISDSPQISSRYWPNPDYDVYTSGRTNYNGSRLAVLDDMGMLQSSDHFQANASDKGFGIRRRLTIDHDGNLRIYSLVNSTGLWMITWQAISQPCQVHGACGSNGICFYALEPKCICTPGYEVNDPNDWNAGCKPTFNKTLLNSEVKFLELSQTDYFGSDLYYKPNFTLKACQELCRRDSTCKGFTYRTWGNGHCYVKNDLFNGFQSPDFPGSVYIKLPRSVKVSKPSIFNGSSTTCESREVEIPVMYAFARRTVRWVYLYSFCAALGALELIFILLGWWFLLMKYCVPAGYRMISSQFRRFNYAELKKITNNFREELGRGGSGTVYKGSLADDRLVAVKRMGDVFQAEDEFWAEMRTIGKINHINLVRMWGFCSEGRHRLLVYEYVDNMSLDKHLFNSNFLGWKQRYAVALGTAKGLAYLHRECLEWVIHCDVKPENILLDNEFQPKIAGFGLAKLSRRDGLGSEITRIRGTKGYMAPDWALNHPITAKVDVYGYGVVVLEIIKGVKLSNWVVDDAQDHETPLKNLSRTVKEKAQCGNSSWVESIVDPRLEGKFSRKQAATLIQVGLSCVEEDRSKRLTMASVVQMLMECDDETELKIIDKLELIY
ncbi:putative receptor protein kinase ZmPK1 isoform X2 [Olea europaea var. sylvestris]|uniref:putative receptor protein kinase ZmPK1 isoform X1 n=1 Tax=Olea europaea var. sylvestris TaxID=158386 RepID=UPI000C1D127E|nr:putative receptor protein kinase ZmPK1 isoform X1 [Olea europaea var. sylvestris]XP_022846629.1 putative receptor protein kinase ZmPK1 isoform X2 [Olea europaea var. sylvestris]